MRQGLLLTWAVSAMRPDCQGILERLSRVDRRGGRKPCIMGVLPVGATGSTDDVGIALYPPFAARCALQGVEHRMNSKSANPLLGSMR